MEIPSKNTVEEIMNFQKFAQSKKGLMYNNEKVWIEGTFKNEGSDKITEGDNFWANEVHTSGELISAEEIYKTYLEWFNRTLRPYEKERIFVSAKIKKQDAIGVEENDQ